MPRLMIKEFDYYQSQWLIFAAWMPYIATHLEEGRAELFSIVSDDSTRPVLPNTKYDLHWSVFKGATLSKTYLQ
jgi:hypothetical protein